MAPGRKTGGRRPGSRNKAAIAREAIAPPTQAPPPPHGMKGFVEMIREAAHLFRAMAAKYQPGGEMPDEAKYRMYLRDVVWSSNNGAPYESSRMAATILGGGEEQLVHQVHIIVVPSKPNGPLIDATPEKTNGQ